MADNGATDWNEAESSSFRTATIGAYVAANSKKPFLVSGRSEYISVRTVYSVQYYYTLYEDRVAMTPDS